MPDQGPTKRLPLVLMPENRDQTSLKDAKVVNAFIEKTAENDYQVYKRPGLSPYSSVTAASGSGIFNWLGDIYSVFGTTLYKNGVSLGTVDGTGGRYFFNQTQGTIPTMFLGNGVKAYTYNSTAGLLPVTQTIAIPFTASITSGYTAVTGTSVNTSLFTVNDGISGVGIPAGAYVASITSSSSFQLSIAATATNATASLSDSPTGLPATFVHGSAWLDATLYVMDSTAKIWGSNLNDPTVWPALNYITAQSEPDAGVALGRQLVYVIAFKQWTTEVFYDAANSVGSPLLPVPASKQPFGCAAADSVQSINDKLYWVATNRSGAKQVVVMEALVSKVISTPSIERLLDNASMTTCFGWTHKEMGHTFYGITLPTANITLVYDIAESTWYQWADSNGNFWPIVSSSYTTAADGHLVQHYSNGKIYTPAYTTTTDDGAICNVDLYTPIYDGGSRFNKMLTSMEFIADQIPGAILFVRWSDDDYQNWTNFRQVNLGAARPILWDCGTFRRRAFHFRFSSNTVMRISAVDLQLLLGVL